MNSLTKENILSITYGGLEIFKFYATEFKEIGKAFSSPFRPDKKPSVSIFKSTSGIYLYKDFAEGLVLNAIDFVMKLKNIDFYVAMNLINDDLMLGLSSTERKVEFEIGGSFDYWNDYGISKEVLKRVGYDLKPKMGNKFIQIS